MQNDGKASPMCRDIANTTWRFATVPDPEQNTEAQDTGQDRGQRQRTETEDRDRGTHGRTGPRGQDIRI